MTFDPARILSEEPHARYALLVARSDWTGRVPVSRRALSSRPLLHVEQMLRSVSPEEPLRAATDKRAVRKLVRLFWLVMAAYGLLGDDEDLPMNL